MPLWVQTGNRWHNQGANGGEFNEEIIYKGMGKVKGKSGEME